MIYVGYKGIQVYAHSFFNDPEATITADMLLAMMSGPGIVPVVLCASFVFVGLWFVAITLKVLVVFAYVVASDMAGAL
jgi:hypothetical protein